MKYFITLLTVLFTFCTAFADNPDDARFGYPKGNKRLEIVNHIAYDLGYSEEHEQAAWVSYALTKKEVQTKVTKRTNNFRFDGLVLTGSAALSDYKGSGYDRGHLAPAADMAWSNQAMSESFFLSNMSPQIIGFNRGIWKKLESQVRNWAIDNSIIYVVTGPIFDENIGSIGVNEVTIPGFYYKVILDYLGPEKKAIGLILRHQSSKEFLESFAVTVDRVEVLTGIDFFADLPDNIEEELESKIDISKWNFKQKNKTYKPSEVKRTTKRKTKQDLKGGTYWITINSGIRHNPTCRWYENSKGRPSTIKEGRACKVCGG
jgi:endonuclease G, mitochondrial